jgi:hypothetical protein
MPVCISKSNTDNQGPTQTGLVRMYIMPLRFFLSLPALYLPAYIGEAESASVPRRPTNLHWCSRF